MPDLEVKPTPTDEERLAMPRPPLDVLLSQADALTRTCRSIWITNILGCLYVWLAIASLRDIQLFIPDEGLVLPILQTEISPAGFFVFAPLLLLANFLHLHIMLGRLWKVWGRLKARGDCLDGLPVGERTTPWLLAALLPGEVGDGWLAKLVAGFFAYWFGPLTILAAGWRYLRAHELDMQVYHAALVALAVTAALSFWLCARQAETGRMRPAGLGWAALNLSVLSFTILLGGANRLTTNSWPTGWTEGLSQQLAGTFLRALSPHAQLFRAELTRKPEGWSEGAYQAALDERARLRACMEEAKAGCPEAEALEAKLAEAKRAAARLHADLTPAALGLELASKTTGASDYCRDIERIRAPRDLLEADLREAHLTGANLTCARMEGADLRGARMEGADLAAAQMDGAELHSAKMKKADLGGAQMKQVRLIEARMEGADLRQAYMVGADFGYSKLDKADFTDANLEAAAFWETRLDSATLWDAQMSGAFIEATSLRLTDFSGTNLTAAAFRDVNLTDAANLSQKQLDESFGDGSVILTCDDSDLLCTSLDRPSHWPVQRLTLTAYIGRWKGWRNSQGLPPLPTSGPLEGAEEVPTVPWDEGKARSPGAFLNPAPSEHCSLNGTGVLRNGFFARASISCF